MGTPEFAVPSLSILLDHGYLVPLVVTAPDKPRGRGQEVSPTPVKAFASSRSIEVFQPASLRHPDVLPTLRKSDPDLIVVVAFRILPTEVFTLPRLGSFNLHASLLPKYRGAAPINWAIVNGESETGVTTFFLQEKVDAGKILLQARVPIKPEDDAGTIHDKLADVGAEIVLHTTRLIEQGKAVPRQQNDALASPAPKIFKEDLLIRWNQPASKIHDMIRGFSPYPAAYTRHRGRKIKIFRSIPIERPADVPAGTITATATSLYVSTSDLFVAILELQQEGRKRMGIEEFLRGYHITTGDVFA